MAIHGDKMIFNEYLRYRSYIMYIYFCSYYIIMRSNWNEYKHKWIESGLESAYLSDEPDRYLVLVRQLDTPGLIVFVWGLDGIRFNGSLAMRTRGRAGRCGRWEWTVGRDSKRQRKRHCMYTFNRQLARNMQYSNGIIWIYAEIKLSIQKYCINMSYRIPPMTLAKRTTITTCIISDNKASVWTVFRLLHLTDALGIVSYLVLSLYPNGGVITFNSTRHEAQLIYQ